MTVEFPDFPELPAIPPLPDDYPVDEQTVRTLWNVVRSLHALLQAEINASRALAKMVFEDRGNLESMFGIIQGHHAILGSVINTLAELKGEDTSPLDLPRLPPNWPSPGSN